MNTLLSDEAVGRLDIAEGRGLLLEEILEAAPLRRPRTTGRWLAAAGAAAAVATVAVAVPALVGGHRAGLAPADGGPTAAVGTDAPAPAPSVLPSPLPAIDPARAAFATWPLEPGWRVMSTEDDGHGYGDIDYGFGPGSTQAVDGGMDVTPSQKSIEITWYPASQYESYYRDRRGPDLKQEGQVEILGQRGASYSYSATDNAAMRPPVAGSFIEVRAIGMSRADFLTVLGQLQGADHAAVLASLPSSFVQPGKLALVVQADAAGIPLPPGFSLDDIKTSETDPYQVAAAVTGAIGCAWLDAYEAGDQQAAVAALATSHDWKILRTMESQGGWSQVFWDTADHLSGATADQISGFRQGIGCRQPN